MICLNFERNLPTLFALDSIIYLLILKVLVSKSKSLETYDPFSKLTSRKDFSLTVYDVLLYSREVVVNCLEFADVVLNFFFKPAYITHEANMLETCFIVNLQTSLKHHLQIKECAWVTRKKGERCTLTTVNFFRSILKWKG